MHDRPAAEVGEQLARARQRAPLGEQLAEDPAPWRCWIASVSSAESSRPTSRATAAREQAAAHPDPPVDPPAVDRHPLLGERALPGEDVRVDRVDQRPVEIEDQGPRHASGA